MSLIDFEMERRANPVDTIEHVAVLRDWTFERTGEDEIAISVSGQWTDYHTSFSWLDEHQALHVACAFDLKPPERRETELTRLLAKINEQMWMGHFEMWMRESIVLYRQSLLLAGNAEATQPQIEGMFANAVEACDRYFQAFQFVVWAGKTASEALGDALFETEGEA